MAKPDVILNDREAAARIEASRGRWAALHEDKIRNEAGIAQTEAELTEALEEARSQLGTDDLDQIRTNIAANYEANTEAVLEFEGSLASVEEGLAAVEQAGS